MSSEDEEDIQQLKARLLNQKKGINSITNLDSQSTIKEPNKSSKKSKNKKERNRSNNKRVEKEEEQV